LWETYNDNDAAAQCGVLRGQVVSKEKVATSRPRASSTSGPELEAVAIAHQAFQVRLRRKPEARTREKLSSFFMRLL